MGTGKKLRLMTPYEESYFSRDGVVHIDAAVVGVSRRGWQCLQETAATKEAAAAIMSENRFDVLPVVNGEEIKKYFYTQKWGDYSSVSEEIISHCDVIPFHTHIRDVIKGFALESRNLESRNFYFLHSERRIVGLISVVNLNCRQVKVYLFGLLSELEVRLGTFITEHVAENKLLNMTFGDNQDVKGKEKHYNVKKRYREDKARGVDVSFIEYLYLSDMISVITKE